MPFFVKGWQWSKIFSRTKSWISSHHCFSLCLFTSQLFPPDFTKHCKLCDLCIKDYDHHCLFLNRCIGRRNHRLFLLFILSMVIAHLLFVATATSYLSENTPAGGRSWSSWLTLLGEEFWVVVMMCMNALTLLWEAWLLIEQFEAIATGTTTYFRQCESSARQRSLVQRWVIVLSFLLDGRRRVGSGQTREDKTAIDIWYCQSVLYPAVVTSPLTYRCAV